MTIQEMHYDFKKKLNKVDSQGNRNLLVPEIDWALNEAITVYINNSASPKVRNHLGFEKSQRMRDSLYPLVVKDYPIQIASNVSALPEDYHFFIAADVLMSKGNCSNIKGTVVIQQQDDTFEEDPFTKSSFEWREVNAVFTNQGIVTFDDGTFTNDTLLLSYIKRHPYVCFPSGFGGSYRLPSGTLLDKDTSCILPEHTHREIVDIAVAMVSGEIGLQDTNFKFQKMQMNQ